MAYQTAADILVNISRETTEGTAATATGASVLRITPSPGLELKRGIIQSEEKRDDGDKSMGRLGNKMVQGSFNGELSAGGANDILLEAISRTTWAAAAPTTAASMTSLTFGTNTITAGAGSWITQLISTGDIVTITGTAVTANHNLRTPVVSVSTLVITVPSGSYALATTAASGTVTRLKKAVSPTTPTKWSHTVEQLDQNITKGELFVGCALVGAHFSFKPNKHVQVTWTFEGINRSTATAAYFTSPTVTTNLPLIADDSVIRFNGATVANFTGMELDIKIDGKGEAVIGSLTSPSIFMNDRTVSGTITALRSDFSNLTLFDAETEFEIQIVLLELESAPKSCLSFFLPRVKIAALSAPVGGGDGAKVETLQLMVAPKDATTGYIASSE